MADDEQASLLRDLNDLIGHIRSLISRAQLDEALSKTEALLDCVRVHSEVEANCPVFFIDIGTAKRDLVIIERGVALLRDLVSRGEPTDARRSLNYNLANGLSELGRLAVEAAGWSYWGLAENEQFQEAKLLLTDLIEDEKASTPPEAWVNYGNTLSFLGRSIEALYAYDQAIRSSPDHPMAKGNKSEALMTIAPLLGASYGETLWEAGRLLAQAIRDPRLGEIGSVGAAQAWRPRLAWIEERLGTKFTGDEQPSHPPADLGALRPAVRRFVEICRDERLFLTYHVLDEHADAALHDAVFIGTFDAVGQADRFNHLATLFNQIKEDYAVARYQFFLSGERDPDRDAASLHTSFADVGDGTIFHLYAGLLKSAFGAAFNVLDKIAFFLNEYLSLGVDEERVTFRTIWRHPEDLRSRVPGITCRVRSELRTRTDGAIVALVDIARDLERDRFKRIRDIRNAQTHRCVVLIKNDPASTPRSGLEVVTWTGMRRETIRLLRTVKSAIFSLAAIVTVEERRRLGNRPEPIRRRNVPTTQDLDLPAG